jgi:aminodeoxyfutalosine synthase
MIDDTMRAIDSFQLLYIAMPPSNVGSNPIVRSLDRSSMFDPQSYANLGWRLRLSKMAPPIAVQRDSLLSGTLRRVIDGHRITVEEGVLLHNHNSLTGLCALADMIKRSRFGDHVFFIDNLHVNTTNICTLACRFCAFRKGPRHSESYALSPEEFVSRIEPYGNSIDEVHAVGGLHPQWTVEHYANLFQSIKARFPEIHIKSLTSVEIKHISQRSGLPIRKTLELLKDAGLDSLPGGGAEILVDSVRDRICRGKELSKEYLGIHETAHSIGIPTNCTMLFGTIETVEERMIHLDRLRVQQDGSGGFQCFVPYPYLPDKTRLPEAQLASSTEIIRVIATSRILLDNIPHIKAYRMNIGDHVACIAINSGADDIDGTVGHEEIMHEAGSTTRLDYSREELARLVIASGLVPIKRNSTYTSLKVFDGMNRTNLPLPIAGQV